MLIFFAFDNDDMDSSKRRVIFLSLIFLLKCRSKSIVIKTNRLWFNEGKEMKHLRLTFILSAFNFLVTESSVCF